MKYLHSDGTHTCAHARMYALTNKHRNTCMRSCGRAQGNDGGGGNGPSKHALWLLNALHPDIAKLK